jgi:hypothetical protein
MTEPKEPREFWLAFCKVTGEVSLYHTVYEARFCGIHETEIIHVQEVTDDDTGRTQTVNRSSTGRGGSSPAPGDGFAPDEHAILPGQNATADADDGIV